MKDKKIKIDGFDKAIIGETIDSIFIYDYEKMVDIVCEKQKLSKEDAEDFLEYNTIRSLKYQENAPIIANIRIKPILFEIESSNGDTIMRFEADLKQGKLKTQNCSIADVDFVDEDTNFNSDYKIRVQQDDEWFSYSQSQDDYTIRELMGEEL